MEVDYSKFKARYWWFIFYIEDVNKDWEKSIADLLQVPFAYCIHDKDLDTDGDERKSHVHMMLCFSNTTTYKHVLNVAKLVSPCVRLVKPVFSVRKAYNYLIHDTKECRDNGKHLYNLTERVIGNGFDIGLFEQLSTEDKQKMCGELKDLIISENICNFRDLQIVVDSHPIYSDSSYFQVILGYKGYLESLCKGNYLALYGKKE